MAASIRATAVIAIYFWSDFEAHKKQLPNLFRLDRTIDALKLDIQQGCSEVFAFEIRSLHWIQFLDSVID